MDIFRALRALPLFEAFDEAELTTLAGLAKVRNFPSGAVLMSQGDFGTSMFVVTAGKARVTLHAPGGPKEIALLGPGEMAGEISLLTGATRTATVTAVGRLEAIEIDKATFGTIVAMRKPILERIAAVIEQRRAELGRVRQDAQAWRTGGFGYQELVAKMTQHYGR
ncbi:cyclic nucleotide-binding domain-containing protein [Prosthecomicrobium pneumaticum]|uniref:CRP-like cAMP-binding protein n=1 Tax=Prosthecomicrobium pneumaticum TaxID=81895 RepID=A0A7W9CTX1_9HYPH|nr:cyclic nucleotide-binding domain-containing protein [Prosthecomicrobium pneumaticum]MBB5751337.1 CRP-like cAMP-binding protein [Prosthecomicrobium pneumaticum]